MKQGCGGYMNGSANCGDSDPVALFQRTATSQLISFLNHIINDGCILLFKSIDTLYLSYDNLNKVIEKALN